MQGDHKMDIIANLVRVMHTPSNATVAYAWYTPDEQDPAKPWKVRLVGSDSGAPDERFCCHQDVINYLNKKFQ